MADEAAPAEDKPLEEELGDLGLEEAAADTSALPNGEPKKSVRRSILKALVSQVCFFWLEPET